MIEPNFEMVKEDVKALPLDLFTIVSVLKTAFEHLKQIDNKELIIALGNTGCGKSTMLTSIIFGPDALNITEQ